MWEKPSGARDAAGSSGRGLECSCVSINTASASPHEVTLVEEALKERTFIEQLPERLTGDRAYDSDPLDKKRFEQGIEMIAPHQKNRKKAPMQEGRPLRRYKRRWKVERFVCLVAKRQTA